MKQLLDFLPILLFFVAFKTYDIYVATAVIMAATAVQMGILYKLDGHLQTMHKVTLGLVLGFGALTLAFHDERFVKLKPTVLYAVMALTLGFGLWIMKKSFLKSMMGKQLSLPDAVWNKLTLVWIGYTLLMSALNGYVAYALTTEQWVNFKIWGYAIPLVFLLVQGLYIAKHMQAVDNETPS
ncbi:MAG: septation protein A [Polaromonas sp.]|nr:septation protein A [Polaromonas sp.]